MSSGVLCIIVIPTEEEELILKQRKLQKLNSYLSNSSTPTTPKIPITIKFTNGPINENNIKINVEDTLTSDIINTSEKLEKQEETLNKVNASLHSNNSTTKIAGIDNNGFEADQDLQKKNFNEKRNQSEDDLKDFMKNYKETPPSGKDESSHRTSKKKLHYSSLDLDIPADSSMVVVLKEILSKLKIENISWSKIRDDKYYQIVFTMECDIKYENLQIMLNEWGIGVRKGSTVSFANCTFNSYKQQEENRKDSMMTDDNISIKNGIWDRFMNNIAARLNVAQIVREVRQGAAITFDFTILVFAAAVLASFGLVEDSVIFLTSSMLISPLMGPIIAGIFGTVIKDHSLSKIGVVNELIGLFMATVVGFVFGLIVCSIKPAYNILEEGLTMEMMSRTSWRSITIGIVTATVSGAAAAIGILGGNVGSLVGVAISASLLPPAVNAGLLWSLSAIYTLYVPDENSKIMTQVGNYSNTLSGELGVLGLLSMLLTLLNIFCVYVAGIIILKLKEIAPVVSNKEFWRYNIKIARDYNRNPSIFLNDTSLADDYAALPKEDQNVLKQLQTLNINDIQYQNTWSPSNPQSSLTRNQNLNDLERLYSATVNSSRYGGGRANSISVEQIRNHLDDLSSYVRRSSMQFEVLTRSPKMKRRSIRPLPTIQASPYEGSPNSTISRSDKTKFTVTPVVDTKKLNP